MNQTFHLSSQFLARSEDLTPAWGPLGQVVYARTYARWQEQEGRRERWEETVRRVVEFSLSLDTVMSDTEKQAEAEALYDAIFHLQGFPSGRTLWMGGSDFSYSPASSIANFNCSSHSIESADDLHDLVYLLMSGTGGGPRITGDVVKTFNRNHPLSPTIDAPVGYLPYVYAGNEQAPEDTELHERRILTVGDSRAGWAQAVATFVGELSAGRTLAVNLNFIRPLGTRLKSFGGYASGPEPLLTGLKEIETIIEVARERGRYTDLDLMDICCLIGRLVVAGGTRRSALMLLGDSPEFASAKTGDWWQTTPWRSQANITVVQPERPDRATLDRTFERLMQYGEPGLINERAARLRRHDFNGVNPCAK